MVSNPEHDNVSERFARDLPGSAMDSLEDADLLMAQRLRGATEPDESPLQTFGEDSSHSSTLLEKFARRGPAGPATMGWQGLTRRLSRGLISPAMGPRERWRREAIATVQRSWSGPKVIMFANPKGGAAKTTATYLAAATFGRHRGGYTVAWDTNETRGTLGMRSIQARHTHTVRDLLADIDRFTGHGPARVGDLDNYLRSQGDQQFDVLASDENPGSMSMLTAAEFDQVLGVLARFYRVICVDTGNALRTSNWTAAADRADELVVVSTVREDAGFSASWMLDMLTETGRSALVRNAVTVLVSTTPRDDQGLVELEEHFQDRTRAVIRVPYDPALQGGGAISYEALSPTTHTAWLSVCAAIANGL